MWRGSKECLIVRPVKWYARRFFVLDEGHTREKTSCKEGEGERFRIKKAQNTSSSSSSGCPGAIRLSIEGGLNAVSEVSEKDTDRLSRYSYSFNVAEKKDDDDDDLRQRQTKAVHNSFFPNIFIVLNVNELSVRCQWTLWPEERVSLTWNGLRPHTESAVTTTTTMSLLLFPIKWFGATVGDDVGLYFVIFCSSGGGGG